MVCRDCFRGTIHDHVTPKGAMQDLYGYRSYVSMPPGDIKPEASIIFFCDAFGLNLPNNEILADHYADKTGCRVLTPDIIPGGGVSERCMRSMNEVFRPIPTWWSLANPSMYFNKIWATLVFASEFVPFMIKSAAPKVYPECVKYARHVRADLSKGAKLGVAGFCWGGYPATRLCGESRTENGFEQLVDASFAAHPSSLDAPKDVVAALGKFKTPYFCAVAEYDFLFDKGAANQTEAAVRKEIGSDAGPYEFFIHKGAHHGFSVRASPDAGSIGKESYELAAAQAISWFKKYLK